MAKCKGCGAEILWATNENDKKIPLDARAIVYRTTTVEGEVLAVPDKECYVTHFATCPKANDFSGSKKKWKGLVE